MIITDFAEQVEIMRKRQGKTLNYLAELIGGTSKTYVRKVIRGQKGKEAEKYRKIIADDLGIAY